MAEEAGALVVLDTHVWLWMVDGNRAALSAGAVEAIDASAAAGGVRVSAISVWEVAMLEARGRLRLSMPVDAWVGRALRAGGVRLLPLTPDIAMESTQLPGEPHGDPADRILVASARRLGARLATCDAGILGYSANGHVSVLDARP